MAILKVSSLRSGYGSVQIINNFSMQVQGGEIVAVIGRNGVGKTTLMKSIIGNVRTSGGSIEYRAKEVSGLPTSARAALASATFRRDVASSARLTVEGNLKLGIGVGDAERANFDRVFSFFPILKKRLSQQAGSMSGGEQQQLADPIFSSDRPALLCWTSHPKAFSRTSCKR